MMSRISPRIIPGLIIAALGVALLLHNFNIVSLGELFQWWPMLLIAVGLQWSIEGRNRVFGALVLIAGGALQLETLGLVDIDWREAWRFWPAAVILFGVAMIRKSMRR